MDKILIKGYKRRKETFGIRNKIIAMSSVSCANSIVEQICKIDQTIVSITHQHGCDHIPKDNDQVLRTLVGVCNNPNVGGILLVGLGCESINIKDISDKIDLKNRIVRTIIIQKIGSKKRIMEIAKKYLTEIKEFVAKQKPTMFNISDLIVGLNCGGSDPFSGITANPAVGLVSDKLVKCGSTVVLAEIPEMIGAQGVLRDRIEKEDIKEKLFTRINSYLTISKENRCNLLGINPTPGNVNSGISSIEEKSLGCIEKGGGSKIREFVQYAAIPKRKGLVVMDTPGNDAESLTGMVAGGAHLVLFTTGLGTPLGNPVAPIIKISSNTKTYRHMRDFIDIDAGDIIRGSNISDVANRIFSFLIEVCNGKKTLSEINECKEFAINRIALTF